MSVFDDLNVIVTDMDKAFVDIIEIFKNEGKK